MENLPKNVSFEEYDENWIENAWGKGSIKEFINNLGNELRPRVKTSLEIANLTPEMRILDIGCGRGEVVFYAARQGLEAVGVDYSTSVLKIANEVKKRLPSELQQLITFHLGDAKKLPFPENYFDRIFMLDLVEHLHDWELNELFAVCHKLLKPDGLLVIHTLPNKWIYDYTYRFLRLFLWNLPKEPRNENEKKIHINEQTIIHLKKLLTQNNFYSRVSLLEGLTAQAEWYRNTIFEDKRDLVYKLLRNPMIKIGLKLLGFSPLKLLFFDDIYALVGTTPEALKKVNNFKEGIVEKLVFTLTKSGN